MDARLLAMKIQWPLKVFHPCLSRPHYSKYEKIKKHLDIIFFAFKQCNPFVKIQNLTFQKEKKNLKV